MERRKAAVPAHIDRQSLSEWLAAAVVFLALAGYLLLSQYQDYLDLDSQQSEQLAHQAMVVEKNLVPQLYSVKRALDAISSELPVWQREANGLAHASVQLTATAQILPGTDRIVVLNAAGKVTASTHPGALGTDYSQAPYFRHLQERFDPAKTYLTAPHITPRGVVTMELVRALKDPSGHFNGMIVAGFSDSVFDTLLDSVHYADDVVSYLAHGDGMVYTTMPENRAVEGLTQASPESLFSQHRNSGNPSGVLSGMSNFGATERTFAFRTIDLSTLGIDKPLVIAVSRERNAIFAHLLRESRQIACWLVALMCLFALTLNFFQRRRHTAYARELRQGQALQASQTRLLTIVESAPECVMLVDANGRIIEMNAFGLALIGAQSKLQILGKEAVELVDAAHRDAYLDMHLEVLWGDASELEFDLCGLSGKRITVKSHAVPMQLDGKTVQLSFTRDITQRKQAEAELRVAARAFESHEGMFITDAQGLVLRINHAFTEITGYCADDIVGRKIASIGCGHPGDDAYRALWDSVLQTGGWRGEMLGRRKNGEPYPQWQSISAVHDDTGAVTHYVGTQHDLTEQKKAEEKINSLAFYDPVTGLPNRTLLTDRLKQALIGSERANSHGALLFIDLDKFKLVNETLGHNIGDALLGQVAQRLTHTAREGDTVAHLGGDDFVVILGNLGHPIKEAAVSAERMAERMMHALSKPYVLGALQHSATACMGVTLFHGTAIPGESYMKQSELAMYQAKAEGRGVIRFFDTAMEVAVKARASIESDLRTALDQQQLVLHFQPQVAGPEAHMVGAEVLVRWNHPVRGLVSPTEFIPMAEDSGLIVPMGRWILESACRQLARWANQPALSRLTLAVNVSARQMSHPDFIEHVRTALRLSGADPFLLKLELTESVLVNQLEEVIKKMHTIKELGVRFSLDDFGTGYSSLSYLKRLPLDQLKIDQSFVRDVLSDPNDAAIVRTVIAFGNSLGLEVIAEGVETASQRDILAQMGCYSYQGYYFSRPVAVQAMEAFALCHLKPEPNADQPPEKPELEAIS